MSENSFFMLGALAQVKNTVSVRLNELLDWSQITAQLKNLYKRDISGKGGQEPYAPLSMFKLVLLGQWHNLSDEALEQALHVRLDFMVFTGFEMGEEMPDSSTICRFRNRLVTAKLNIKLLEEINRQLEDLGLMVKGAQAALVDATIIPSAARPRQHIEASAEITNVEPVETAESSVAITESTETTEVTATIETAAATATIIQSADMKTSTEITDTEPAETTEADVTTETTEATATMIQSADSDARWLKKGTKSHFGCRVFTRVDESDGYVRWLHTTPANASEQTQFATIVASIKDDVNEVLTDKGFTSAANRQLLKSRGIRDSISHKAVRGRALTTEEKQQNKAIASRRFKVEQAFGTLKRRFNMARARYFSTAKVTMQMTLAAIGHNLLKAQRKMEALNMQKRVIWG